MAILLVLGACQEAPRADAPSGSPPISSTALPSESPSETPAPLSSGPVIDLATLRGRVTFSRGDDVYAMNADGTEERRLTEAKGPEFDPTWSPDGSKVAYRDSTHGVNDNDEIFVVNADGTHRINLTRNSSNDWGPAWSPDGRHIAFNSSRDLLPQLYVMDSDGSRVRRVTEREAEYPAWSPDGKRLVFMSQQPDARGTDPNYDVYVVDVDGSDLRQLTNYPGEDGWAAWSPDGRHIAFTTSKDDEGQSGDIGPYWDIYTMDPDGQNKRRLIDIFGGFPTWSPDGGLIMFSGSRLPLSGERLWVVRDDGDGLAEMQVEGSFPDWIA
jgi:Tol biopolymer transport system component